MAAAAAVPAGAMAVRGVEIVAEAAEARGPDGIVFRDVTFTAPRGSLTVLAGPAGSGRTSLLLAVGGRFRTSGGLVRVDGRALPGAAGAARKATAVARARPVVDLDERLRVGEHIAERRVIGGRGVTDASLSAAFRMTGFASRHDVLTGELSALDTLLLAVSLALAEGRTGILVDDVDAGLDALGLERAWQVLRSVADSGPTVLATANIPPPMATGRSDVTVVLPGRETHRRQGGAA